MSPTTTTKRQIYRVGKDIYNAATNQRIGSTEWANSWSGKTDVQEIATPEYATKLANEAKSIAATGTGAPVSPVGEVKPRSDLPTGWGADTNNKIFRYDAAGKLNTAPVTPTPAPTPAPTPTPAPAADPVLPDLSTLTATSIMTPEEYQAKYGPESVDEAKIREGILKQNQARIDAVDAATAEMLRIQGGVNQENEGIARGLAARSGTLTSDFGAADMSKARAASAASLKGIETDRAGKIAGILSEVDQMARAEITAKRAEAVGRAEDYRAYAEQAQTQAKAAAQALGESGVSFDQLKEQAPDQLATILKNTGFDEFTLATVMNGAKKAAEKIDYTFSTVGNTIIGYGLNPMTGQIETIKKELPVEAGTNLVDYTPTTLPDGTLIMVPKKIDSTKDIKDQILMFGAQGQFAKSGSETSFTLNAGQTRYDEKGNVIASAPQKETTETEPTSYKEWVLAGRPGTYADWVKKGGGSLSTDEKAFYDDIGTQQTLLSTGKATWGQAFNAIKAKYGAPDDVIDALLDKGKWYSQ